MVTVDGTTVTRNAEYYALGHMSKFVLPGAVRIGSENTGDLHNVAFRNPDGSIALVVKNIGAGTQTFGVSHSGMTVGYTLAPNALATLTWPGADAGGDVSAPTTPTGLAAADTTQTSTRLTWTASTDNVGVTGYTIQRNGAQVGTSATPTFSDTGLTASTTYSYTVRARDAAGNLSAPSGALSVTTAPAGGGGGPIDPARWYQVVNTNSGKCLDVADFGTANGTPLQQWACNSPVADNQQWQFRPTAGGYYQVVSRYASSLVWEVAGGQGATADGTTVHLRVAPHHHSDWPADPRDPSASGPDRRAGIQQRPPRGSRRAASATGSDAGTTPTYETGWHVLPALQGSGLATAAARLIAQHAREHGSRPALHAFPSADHAASNAVCRKAGFALVRPCDFAYPAGRPCASTTGGSI